MPFVLVSTDDEEDRIELDSSDYTEALEEALERFGYSVEETDEEDEYEDDYPD